MRRLPRVQSAASLIALALLASGVAVPSSAHSPQTAASDGALWPQFLGRYVGPIACRAYFQDNMREAVRAVAIDAERLGDGYNAFTGLGPRWRTMVHRHPTGWGSNEFISGREFRVSSLWPGALIAMITLPSRFDSPLSRSAEIRRASGGYGRRIGFVRSVEFDGSIRVWRMQLDQVDPAGRRTPTIVEFHEWELYHLVQLM